MAELFDYEPPPRIYWDRKTFTTLEEHISAIRGSKTVYVGNLSFYTTEAQIHELFSRAGDVARVIMGLDRHKLTPCGFCFVEYHKPEDATAAINFIHDTTLDERNIKAELDPGFRPGRQYGRGTTGGQVRDERRANYDPARGGLGAEMALSMGLSQGVKRQREEFPEARVGRGDGSGGGGYGDEEDDRGKRRRGEDD